jgi:RNA polymerase sigma factor (sigma-70 family)
MRLDTEPTTHTSLLLRLRDPRDDWAWTRFVDVYGPLVYRYVRRRGFQDADAADLTQDVLRSVAHAMRSFQYDPTRGSFRGWLFTATRHVVERARANQRRRAQAGGSEFERLIENQPEPTMSEEQGEWDREFEQRLFDWAAEQVRKEVQAPTWEAFWRTAVEHAKPRDVAAALGLSVSGVYVAKSRVLARLRAVIEEFKGE